MSKELLSYIGTKSIKASEELTKKEYNDIRGWEMPEGEDPNEIGRLVAYPQPEGKEGNHPDYPGLYVSWSPKFAFDPAYKVSETFMDRLLIERDELKEKIDKLSLAVENNAVPDSEVPILYVQLRAMMTYWEVLKLRINK